MPVNGARLRDLRHQRGLTAQDVATKMGIGISSIWRWEKGEAQPSGEKISRLAEVLQTSTDYLLGATTDSLPQMSIHDLSENERALVDAFRRNDFEAAMRLMVAKKR